MENVKIATKQFLKNVWRFIQPLKTALNANRLYLLGGVIGLDQLIKYFALKENLPNWEVFSNLICNQNLSLGLNLSLGSFILSWSLAIGFLLFLIVKTDSWFLILVLGGALSNLIDRIFLGCITDYILIFTFPVFNLADFFISLGFILFIFISRPIFKKS